MISGSIQKILIGLYALILSSTSFSQNLIFKVTTTTYNGAYAPYNCFAIWITDSKGTYIKTINRQSTAYSYYLTNWKNSSGGKMTDGVTGATLSSHNYPYSYGNVSRIPFHWDCKDYKGTLVPDGDYFINVEFTEEDATGKYTQYQFTKGSVSQTISYPNVKTNPAIYFQNATLEFTPAYTETPEISKNKDYDISYNVANHFMQINFDIFKHKLVKVRIIDLKGSTLTERISEKPFSFQLHGITTGIYFIRLTDNKNTEYVQKIILK